MTFKSLTVSRCWRWRECGFRARTVTWKEAAKALLTLTAHDMWVRGSTKQKNDCWTRAVWLGWRRAWEASSTDFYVVTSLCNECKRRGRREFLWALERDEQKHQDGSQAQLVLESFHQSLQLGKELSILPPTSVPAGAPFPCYLTAIHGYQHHERMTCRST